MKELGDKEGKDTRKKGMRHKGKHLQGMKEGNQEEKKETMKIRGRDREGKKGGY